MKNKLVYGIAGFLIGACLLMAYSAFSTPRDKFLWHTALTIDKARLNDKGAMVHYATEKYYGNAALKEGVNEVWALVTGDGGDAFSAANAIIQVGNGTTAVDPDSQTALQGGSTDLVNGVMIGSYPYTHEVDGDTYNWKSAFQAEFVTTEANFAWEEWGLSNGTILLNRALKSMGTKTSSEQWTVTVELYGG